MANDIEVFKRVLPTTTEELFKFVLIGEKALESYNLKLAALNKIPEAKELRDRTLGDGQFVSRKVLEAEAKLGELLEKIPDKKATSGSGRCSLPEGINWKFSHYAQELHRNPELIEKAIDEAQEHQTVATRHDVLKMVKIQKRAESVERQRKEIERGIEEPKSLYDLIVVDPPWDYKDEYDPDTRRGTCPYPTLNLSQLKEIKLPVKDNSIIWLWTTDQFIWNAKELMDTWGFTYKNILVWDKGKMGVGKWLRLQCEFCLLGIRGKPLWEVQNMRDIIREPRTKHSRKPDEFYSLLRDNFVGKKLDYFGREKHEGFDVYGVEEK